MENNLIRIKVIQNINHLNIIYTVTAVIVRHKLAIQFLKVDLIIGTNKLL